jgi:hypothetical protein
MSQPPDGVRKKPYAGEPAHTADRVPIVNGLAVFTNNLDHGHINLSRSWLEWHEGERRYVLWFDVNLDRNYKGNPTTGSVLQSDDRVSTVFNGKSA